MKTEFVTTLKRQATKLISDVLRAGSPILITEQTYLVDVKSYEAQQERVRILEGIARGERAVQEGSILTHEQAKKRMRKWLA